MSLLFPIGVTVLMTCGVYLILRRSLLRVALGILFIGHAANLVIFSATEPKLASLSIYLDPNVRPDADPLPQALILTAIVIGFGLVSFFIALAVAVHRRISSDNLEDLGGEE